VGGKQIPYVVAGMGGYYNLPGLKPGKQPAPPKTPASGTDASNNPLTMEVFNDTNFGFLRITVSPASITGEFVTVDPSSGKTGVGDSFTLDLHSNTVSNSASAGGGAAPKAGAKGAAKVKPQSGAPAKRAPKAGATPPKAKGKSSRKK
jgi:hypothetical protein